MAAFMRFFGDGDSVTQDPMNRVTTNGQEKTKARPNASSAGPFYKLGSDVLGLTREHVWFLDPVFI